MILIFVKPNFYVCMLDVILCLDRAVRLLQVQPAFPDASINDRVSSLTQQLSACVHSCSLILDDLKNLK